MKRQETKRKILLVKWGGLNKWGGMIMLLLNLLKHMDRDQLVIDLYVFGNITSDSIYEAVCALDVNVITGNHDTFDSHQVLRDLNALIRKNRYDVVHSNTGGISLTTVTMLAAWLNHVPVRIAHSHNAKPNVAPYSWREKLYQRLNKALSTVRLACSNSAAEHIFGKKGAEDCFVLKNGIEPEKYAFNPEIRVQKRKELGLEDAFVVGHVGRFEKQKNHEFLIRVFAEIKKRRGNAVLMLLGSGSLMDEVKAQVKQLGLTDSVRFIGDSDCVPDYLQAMDVFVFPSLFEGLGIVAIEAQATGLPTVCSDTVPQEAAVSSQCVFLSLEKSEAEWSERILSAVNVSQVRNDKLKDIQISGYNIIDSAQMLEKIYKGQNRSLS